MRTARQILFHSPTFAFHHVRFAFYLAHGQAVPPPGTPSLLAGLFVAFFRLGVHVGSRIGSVVRRLVGCLPWVLARARGVRFCGVAVGGALHSVFSHPPARNRVGQSLCTGEGRRGIWGEAGLPTTRLRELRYTTGSAAGVHGYSSAHRAGSAARMLGKFAGLTDSELTDLENAGSHAVNHQPVRGQTIPGQTEETPPRGLEKGRRQKLNHSDTKQQLDLYESLENNDALLTSGPSHELWEKWQQLDTVRATADQPRTPMMPHMQMTCRANCCARTGTETCADRNSTKSTGG